MYVEVHSEEQLREFLAESLIMKDFHHPHVLGLLGVCFDTPDGSPYIVLPFMANGSLKKYLMGNRVHSTRVDIYPQVCLTVFIIAQFMYCIHSITRRDSNFLHSQRCVWTSQRGWNISQNTNLCIVI